jgi:acyl dehydratase
MLEMLRTFVGTQERPVVARDPVGLTRTRMFVEAIGDTNPIYLDAAAARTVGHPGPVAPAGLLQAWTMPGLGPLRDEDGPTARLYRLLDGHGYTGLIAVGYRQDYVRYLVPGDHVTANATIASVSEEKRTWVGPGHFLSTDTVFTDQHGATVGSMTWTVLKYRPTPAPPRPPGESTLDGLPALAVPVTATMIVGGALATNDYTPIHHDLAAARAAGFADIFMNILTTCGLVQRYVTEWAGPAVRLRDTEFRLGGPCYPGDTLTFTGQVDGADGDVVEVVGRNDRGVHVLGRVGLHRTATTSLPTVSRE